MSTLKMRFPGAAYPDLVLNGDGALQVWLARATGLSRRACRWLLGQPRLLPGKGGLLVGGANVAFTLVEIIVTGLGDDLAAIDLAIMDTSRFINSRSCDVISTAPGKVFRNCTHRDHPDHPKRNSAIQIKLTHV